MFGTIQKRIEHGLYARGFYVPDVRTMARHQILILLLALPAAFLGGAGQAFAAGTALGTINFLALGKVLQELVFMQKGALPIQLFSFYGRLALTALALYLLIVFAGASGVWLLLGLSTVLANILLWGMSQILGKTS